MHIGYSKEASEEELSNLIRRTPVLICVDTSGSMNQGRKNGDGLSRIEKVRRGIDAFYQEVINDETAFKSVELCIVGFSLEPYMVREFSAIKRDENAKTLKFEVKGKGDLGFAVLESIELLNARKEFYKYNDITYKQPTLIIMSDGHATGDNKAEIMSHINEAQKETTDLEENKKLTLIPVYMGEDFANDPKAQQELSGFSKVNRVLKTGEDADQFLKFFRNLGRSVSASANGNNIIIDDIDFDDF